MDRVTQIDERIMLLRMRHTLGFVSIIAVYAPTEARELDEKELFYAKLDSVIDQCPRRDTILVMGDFNAVTGTDRAGYEMCVGPHGSGTRNINSSLLLNFARSRRLRIAGSWFQRSEPRRWSWYSNAGGVAKEIDHILVSTRWRILKNCRVYRSAEFFGTDHRLVVATLRLHLKTQRITRNAVPRYNLGTLKDATCAHEYAIAVSNQFEILGDLEDPADKWEAFKRGTLKAVEEHVEKLPRSRSGVASPETVEIIDMSRTARLAGDRVQYRTLTRRARAHLREDKESYVRGIAEEVEDNFNANFLRPAYRALNMLRSKSAPQVSSIRSADGRLVSDAEEYRARWAEYFEQLYRVDPPSGQLPLAGEQMAAADPPIDVTAPSLAEVRKVVEGVKDDRAALKGKC